MDRYMVISSDGHAGPHAAEYRGYVDPEYREMFDVALPVQIQMTQAAAGEFPCRGHQPRMAQRPRL